jgi:peptide-N4-(N-acetyl-beta-glucosaminyl)asparagine amidase
VRELRQELVATFGMEFIEEHEFKTSWTEAEMRTRVKTLLSALKHSYRFYRQTCLTHEEGDEKCDRKEQALLVGQIACAPEYDTIADDCVYAELRHCSDCNGTSRFFEYARFHGPLQLFGTRRNRDWVMGQCEEFSRAGYALLASLGYEARYVLDFTDHVWIEVRLPSGGNSTWFHADPSEGVLDSPLMYEKGWGKQLSMIFAFTPMSVEHVTARYTNDYQATVYRRGISEEQLEAVLTEANERLKYELPMNKWGYTSEASHQWRSVDRSFEEIALWSHFETP